MNVDSTNINDLFKLINKINLSDSKEKAHYLAKLHFARLMVAQLPFIQRISLNWIYTHKGYDKAVESFYHILVSLPDEEIDIIYGEFLHHIIHGKDASNTNSVGGYNQIELFMIQSIFNLIGS